MLEPHKYEVNLGKDYTGNKMHLNSFTMPHLCLNLTGDDSDLSIYTYGSKTTLKATEYLTQTTLDEFWNENNPNLKLELVAGPSYTNKHRIQFRLGSNVAPSTLWGKGWVRLGFNIGIEATVHNAVRIYDYMGPKLLNVFIEPLNRTHKIQSTFQIPVTAPFGSVISHQFFEEQTT